MLSQAFLFVSSYYYKVSRRGTTSSSTFKTNDKMIKGKKGDIAITQNSVIINLGCANAGTLAQ